MDNLFVIGWSSPSSYFNFLVQVFNYLSHILNIFYSKNCKIHKRVDLSITNLRIRVKTYRHFFRDVTTILYSTRKDQYIESNGNYWVISCFSIVWNIFQYIVSTLVVIQIDIDWKLKLRVKLLVWYARRCILLSFVSCGLVFGSLIVVIL